MKKHLLLIASVILPWGIRMSGQTTTTIDGNIYAVDTLQHAKAGPGSYYTAIKFTGSDLTFRTFYLEVETNQANLELRTELGRDSIIGTENISFHAQRKTTDSETYFAAVNGDFFEVSGDVGAPVNGAAENGVLAAAATKSPHFLLEGASTPWITSVTGSCTYKVNDGEPVPLTRVNGRIGENELILFNSLNGNHTHTPAGTSEIALELLPGETWSINQPIRAKVSSGVRKSGNAEIATGQAVLSASGTKRHCIESLNTGDELEITFTQTLDDFGGIAPAITQMVGGNAILLKAGKKVPQSNFARHPRTMLGYDKDKTKIILAVVDGRSALSSGATYHELADLMKWANAYDAINIDGGGSSSLYLQNLGLMNRPSDGKERAVGNGVYCVLKAPADEKIAEIRFADWKAACPRNGTYTPRFYGYNRYGILVDADVKGVTLSCDKAIGKIIDGGRTFYGSGSGTAALKATYGDITATIPVTVE